MDAGRVSRACRRVSGRDGAVEVRQNSTNSRRLSTTASSMDSPR